jgi:hypothetical protein
VSGESAVKATAAGLQPKSLDLTALARARVASRVESTRRVANDEAAYVLGFSVADLYIQDEWVAGAPLAAVLLRLKYADQFSLACFATAHRLLVQGYGNSVSGICREPQTMAIVAQAALVEWLQDSCPKCRGGEAGQVKARRCTETGCAPGRIESEPVPYRDPWGEPYRDREGNVLERDWVAYSPLKGCVKCGGVGRVFSAPKEARGIRCLSCHGKGRVIFKHRRRYRLVNELMIAAERARGAKPQGMKLSSFTYWSAHYEHFLGVLRAMDRQMGAGLAFGARANVRRDERLGVKGVDADGRFADNAAIELAIEEKQDAPAAERPVGQPAGQEPEQPTGNVPPEETEPAY